MNWLVATLLLGAGGAYAVWPLIRHWQAPAGGRTQAPEPGEAEIEELELEVAAGRLSEAEAAARRRELGA